MNKNEGKIKKKIVAKEIDQDWKGNFSIQRLQMKHKKVKNINYKLFLISLERKSAKSSRYEAGDLTQNVRTLYYETAEFLWRDSLI